MRDLSAINDCDLVKALTIGQTLKKRLVLRSKLEKLPFLAIYLHHIEYFLSN